MATRQHSISGISSRRSACDKCRFSKARCLRAYSDQARCDRCSRTGCECVTSPIFRLRTWQPPAASDDAAVVLESSEQASKRQRRRLSKPSELGMVQDLHLLSEGAKQSPVGGVAPDQDLDWHGISSAPDLPYLLYGTGLDQPVGASFDHVDDLFDISLSEDFYQTVPPAASGTESITSFLSPPPLNAEMAVGPTSHLSHLDEQVTLQNSNDNALGSNDKAPVDTELMPLQRLSKLDYELITLLIEVDQGPPRVSMETLVQAVKDSNSQSTVDAIVSKTTDFINLLKLLANTPLPPPSISPDFAKHSERHGPQSPRRTSCSTDSSEYDSITDSPTHEMRSTNRSPSSAASPPAHHELDMPSLLLVLTVYIRLLRLHLIVFANVYENLKKLSRSENQRLRPVPGLSISSFPIQSGNLQTIILIQVVTSLFERIDKLLGLPREFRISRRRGEQQGLLSTPYFLEIATSILRKEDVGRPENGKGGIKALRKHIAKAKQLLRESIAP